LRPKNDCVTENTLIIGSHNWTPNLFIKLIQNFGLEVEVATHLAGNYGDRAWAVASMASQTGSRWPIFGTRIAMGYPYIEAEVRYTCRREYACTAVDVLARRTRLSFLNAKAALESIPRVIDIMAVELGWTPERKKQEYEQAKTFLYSMGLSIKDEIKYPVIAPTTPPIQDEEYARFFARTHFLPHELQTYKQIFASLDFDNDSKISSQDFSKALGTLGLKMSQTELEQIISEVDLNKSGSIEFIEFLQVLAAVKDIRSRSKFARIIADYQDRKQFPTDRSGGGI
jgi:glycerol-3-phosphate dehydrogenase